MRPSAERLVADAERPARRADILVNCAATQFSRDSTPDISSADFDETFKTNVYAMKFRLTKAAVSGHGAGLDDHQHHFGQRL